MNIRKFIAANTYLIGTGIIIFGFSWMVIQAIIGVSFEQTIVAFFITISGIIFWWIGARIDRKQEKLSKPFPQNLKWFFRKINSNKYIVK